MNIDQTSNRSLAPPVLFVSLLGFLYCGFARYHVCFGSKNDQLKGETGDGEQDGICVDEEEHSSEQQWMVVDGACNGVNIQIAHTASSKKRDKMPRKVALELYKQRQPSEPHKVLSLEKVAMMTDHKKSLEYGHALRSSILQRKFFDNVAFACISRPQYKYSCGASSLTGVWNYLFSSLGHGELPPITQTELLQILGFSGDFSEISFGPFTGNDTIIKWFHELCNFFKVNGKGAIMWKEHGKGKTLGMTEQRAKDLMKEAITNKRRGLIYHCHNHYMVPIGFDESSTSPLDAYSEGSFSLPSRTYILVGDSSKTSVPVHAIRFEDIAKDLKCASPEFYNVRHPHLSVQTRKTKVIGSNVNCIMVFERTDLQEQCIKEFGISLKQRILQYQKQKTQRSREDEVIVVVEPPPRASTDSYSPEDHLEV